MIQCPAIRKQQLLTRSMEKSIDVIIECRKTLKITKCIYLFARPGLNTPFDGSKVMREMKLLCPNLTKREYLTATGFAPSCSYNGACKKSCTV